jgi:rhamnulokinase
VSDGTHCLALDFGASSIRVIDVGLAEGRLSVAEFARIAHGAQDQDGRLVWDYPVIYRQIEHALETAGAAGHSFDSIGADSWGVDYVLLDEKGARIGYPVSYRDGRTDGTIEEFTSGHIDASRLFAHTGLPPLAFNTLYQLFAQSQKEPDLLRRADQLLFTADYAHFWLSGVAANERSLASTSQMLALDGSWWSETMEHLVLPSHALRPPVAAGTVLGVLRPALASRTRLGSINVIAPAAHDTQSAILAVPATGKSDWAYLSSGTWSILGAESDVLWCDARAEKAGLGNEQGYGGTYCVQSTETGLWLVQEIQRLLCSSDPDGLAHEAEQAQPFRSLINPAAPRFFHPADMISEIQAACREAGEPLPETAGELTRCAYDSLALLYRQRLSDLADVTGRTFERLHIVGGGSQAMLLNRLCATAVGIPVLAGPQEATAIGNGLAQLIALGVLADVADARALVHDSFPPVLIEPVPFAGLDDAVARFGRITKLQEVP